MDSWNSSASSEASKTTPESVLYKVNSYECFHNLEYQQMCILELYDRVVLDVHENGAPNGDELMLLLRALYLQAPNFQLPLPPYLVPVIRFCSEKVPYFEFHFFTNSLPLMKPLQPADLFLKTVNHIVLERSAEIFKLMEDAHNFWSTNQVNNHRTPMQQRFHQEITYFQESANSSGKLTSTFLSF